MTKPDLHRVVDEEAKAFLDGWGPRWVGPERASILLGEATKLLERARLYAPHHVPVLEQRWREAYKAVTQGPG